MERKHGQNYIEIMKIFLENPDKILTTAEITTETGIHKSVVSRELKKLSEQMQVTKIKAGHYQLLSPVFSGKWTKDDNKNLIDRMLNHFDDQVMPMTSRLIRLACLQGDFRRAVYLLKLLTQTLDVLLHRWSIEHKGYDNNSEQARQDTKLALSQQPPTEAEDEEDHRRPRAWDPVNKKFLD